MSDDLKSVHEEWSKQSLPLKEIDIDKLTTNVDKFEKDINLRNSLEWSAALITVPLFIYYAVMSKTLWSQLFNLEIAFTGAFITFYIFRRGRFIKNDCVEVNSLKYIDHQRKQIEKQIELLSSARYWYVMPIMIGLLGLTFERIYLNWSTTSPPWFDLAYLVSVVALGFGLVYLNEVVAVKKLQEKLRNLSYD